MKVASLVLALAACGGSVGPTSPAADGVRGYLQALRANDARAAYDLMSADTRHQISFDEFDRQWKQTTGERAWQAQVLEESLKGNPDVGERAVVSFHDGKLVELEREGRTWRLQSELVGRSRAKDPHDAIRLFAEAVAGRDVNGALDALTERRRDGIVKQVQGFIAGLAKHQLDALDPQTTDRAELRWDENGIRYRIVLRKEHDEWRIDDIYIRPEPKDDDADKSGERSGPDF